MPAVRSLSTVPLTRAAYAPGSEYTEIGSTTPTLSHMPFDIRWQKARRKAKVQPRLIDQRLDVTIVQSPEHGWIADESVTGQFGVGPTPSEAVADLMETLRGYLEILRTRQYSLVPYLREQVKWLEARLV